MAVLLGILAPEGVLGDTLDSTYIETTGVDGTRFLPSAAVQLVGDLGSVESVEFVRFKARVSWWPDDIGPQNPSIAFRYKLATTGEQPGEAYFVEPGLLSWQQVPNQTPENPEGDVDIPTAPDGGAWDVDKLAVLFARMSFFVDSGASEATSHVAAARLWAEVWGERPVVPPEPEPEDPGDVEVERETVTVLTPLTDRPAAGDGAAAQTVPSPLQVAAACDGVDAVTLHAGNEQEAL